ncbi:MAG: sulfate ABC transporter substrate-binding protein [Puniceicoccales bacterium]|jgi:sulfate transport system substrate-binding protein|nr:sulfate ABC transporter substrate-binding protein [Puniceicoccales bacterium]
MSFKHSFSAIVVPFAVFAALFAIFPRPPLHASACCAGFGDFGLDGRWISNAPKPEEVLTVTVENAATPATRAFFSDINKAFGKAWVAKTNCNLVLSGAHGPAFAHLRSVLGGGSAPDIVAFDSPEAVDSLAAAGHLPANWRTRLPNGSVPFYTTFVFLVRKGNPKGVRGWGDLFRPDVALVLPDPRHSSVGQWAYLAAWADALGRAGGVGKAREAVFAFYKNAVSLHGSADGAAEAFLRGGAGDVLVLLECEEFARRAGGEITSAFETVSPPTGLRVEYPVAWLDKSTGGHGTTRVSASLLMYLFETEAQEVAARHHLRPFDPGVAQKHAAAFAPIRLAGLEKVFGDWASVQKRFFAAGSELDRDYPRLVAREVWLPPRPAIHRRPAPAPAPSTPPSAP